MREILFRGKRLNDGSWVYGYYVHQYGSNLIYTDKEHAEYEFDNIHVVPATVGQYTGMQDKNGTRIFEGDIVEGADFCEEEGFGEIIWDEDAARFAVIGSGLTVDFDNYYGYELLVRGNVHDNPELLEEEA